MIQHDSVPVVKLPDGRWALIDTGFTGPEAGANTDAAPVDLGDRIIRPIMLAVDIGGIAQAIGAPRVDMLIGALVLNDGFTLDIREGLFCFAALPPDDDEKLALALPFGRDLAGVLQSPIVEVEISGERVTAIFDTGAAYSLWKYRHEEPDRQVDVTRTDFHVDAGGNLVEFAVLTRPETVRAGAVAFGLHMAYLPDTTPPYWPRAILGMDVPEALGASSVVLDPAAKEIRFYKPC